MVYRLIRVGPDQSRYQVNVFLLISPQTHILWVLIILGAPLKSTHNIALVKALFSIQKYGYFSYFSMKTCCGTHQKRLAEALLMSTHSICFHGEIRKIYTRYPPLSRPMPQHIFLWKNKKISLLLDRKKQFINQDLCIKDPHVMVNIALIFSANITYIFSYISIKT